MRDRVLRLLADVAEGKASPADALEKLAWMPVETVTGNGAGLAGGMADDDPARGGGRGRDGATGDDDPEPSPEAVPFARLDHNRGLRQGQPEVIFGPGKTVDQLLEICRRFQDRGDGFLVTRTDDTARVALAERFPEGHRNDVARTFHLPADEPLVLAGAGSVLVVSAGTGDLPVAEEAAVTAAAFGNPVSRLYDVGVAGIHRVLGELDTLRAASVVIVVAGMEGALPSVVGGLVRVPVVAVPTSIGYGASFGGLTPLLGMLNSCAAGITVVNIDNGFGAACAATRINQVLAATSTE